jgi:chromosome segregation ATPase
MRSEINQAKCVVKNLSIIFSLIFVFTAAQAEVNVEADIQKLEENKDNSKLNYEQYKKNYNISKQNISVIKKSIKTLRAQKRSVSKNDRNIEKNKKALEKMKVKVISYKAKEQKKQMKEVQDIEELKALLVKMETNLNLRNLNVQEYDKKIAEIVKEKLEWDEQNQDLETLRQTIVIKESEAKKEHKNWIGKKKDYRRQMGKWKSESKIARQRLKKYKKLAN